MNRRFATIHQEVREVKEVKEVRAICIDSCQQQTIGFNFSNIFKSFNINNFFFLQTAVKAYGFNF